MQSNSTLRRFARLTSAWVVAVAAAGLGASPAFAAPPPAPGVRLVYGTSPAGPHEIVQNTPEYQASRYAGPLVFVTVVNTGWMEVQVRTLRLAGKDVDPVQVCSGSTTVPAGGSITCADYVTAPAGYPGTTLGSSSSVTVSGTTGYWAGDTAPLTWRFYDVLPTLDLRVAPSTPIAESGETVRFDVTKTPPAPWTQAGQIVSLRSDRFGDLRYPAWNSGVSSNCGYVADTQPCSYWVRLTGAGSNFTDTVRMTVTDGTGPTVERTAAVRVHLRAVPSVHLVWGGPSGDDHTTLAVPEHGRERTRELTVTALNTSGSDLDVTKLTIAGTPLTAANCGGSFTLPAGGRLTCRALVTPPVGTTGEETIFRAIVEVGAEGRTAADEAVGWWRFTDAVPMANLTVTADPPAVPAPGGRVRFLVTKPLIDQAPRTASVVTLTSQTFGNLMDPRNSRVRQNTCPTAAAGETCTFTALVPADRTYFRDTFRLELSDGSGPTGTMTHSILIDSREPVVRSSLDWAEGVWPDGMAPGGDDIRSTSATFRTFRLLPPCDGRLPATLADLLAMWRCYGGRGESYAIGLDPSAPLAVLADPGVDLGLGRERHLFHRPWSPVHYDLADQRRLADAVLDGLPEELAAPRGGSRPTCGSPPATATGRSRRRPRRCRSEPSTSPRHRTGRGPPPPRPR